eukprot:TRINITY_DN315_c0_g2_i2.p1 TRINITY_DN315_c0_g2~~TRINITY_DN315_c0_g2_i2.p1  ORF type:complete len:213 (-),score=28.62 TRINITY_DN315_c0_g2_i2:146-784(-)
MHLPNNDMSRVGASLCVDFNCEGAGDRIVREVFLAFSCGVLISFAAIMIIVTEVSHASVSSDTSSVVHKIDDGSVMQNGSASSYSSNVCGETAISVEVTGGFPPYTTYVDGAVLPESASDEVPAGHHEVKVRDSHECYSNSADVNVPYCEPKHVREGLRLWKAYGVWAVLATSVCVGIVAVVATAAVVFQLVRLRRKSSRSGILLETMSKFI